MVRFSLVVSSLWAASLPSVAVVANSNLRSEEKDHTQFPHPVPKAFCFGEEKGARCMGHYKDEKGEMKCEAGMRKNFTASFKAADMLTNVAETLHAELLPQVVPSSDFFLPHDDRVLQDLMVLEESYYDETKNANNNMMLQTGHCDKDGCHMAFEGKATLEYGCKMSFAMKDGKVTKNVACGIKGVSSAGKKEHDEGEHGEDDNMVMMNEQVFFEMA